MAVMKVIEIVSKNKFDQFVENHSLGNIHQTWDWGEFQIKSGWRDKMWTLALEDKEIHASALLIRQRLPMGKCWLYCPRGPLVDYSNEIAVGLIFDKIAEIAKAENAVFVRFDPPLPEAPRFPKSHTAHAQYQPQNTLIIDLQPSTESILKQMKSKGRYNIKVAQKHNVKITQSKDLKKFHKLLSETTARDNFSGHPIEYYQNMLSTLGSKRAKLYLAEYKNQPVAGVISTYFKDTVTYYFGASSSQNRNTMAPYLLHWQVMQDAKKDGYKNYDLFGIAPENQPKHHWAGVSQFKLKFGGKRINYMPAQEIIYQPFWYQLIKIAKFLRRS